MPRAPSPLADRRHPVCSRILLSCGALPVLALATYWAARLAWADRLSASPRLEDRRRAVLLVPFDAALFNRLAEKLQETGGDPLPSLRAAVAADPDNPQWRMSLAQQAELAGDLPLAEQNLLAAARLSRLYQPKFLLAGYYFRRGNADLCLRWSRAALAIAPGDVTPCLNLLGRLLEPDEMADEGLRQSPPVTRQILSFLALRGQVAAAQRLARHLAETGTIEDLPCLLGYAGQLLAEGHASHPVELWNALCRRRLLPYEPLDVSAGQSLTNAGFQHNPSGSGFDWHVEAAPGITNLRLDGALRAGFSGDQADDCVLTWQYIPLQPGGHYRLRHTLQAENSASAAGLGWRILYPHQDAGWIPLEADPLQGFRSPSELVRLVLTYRRAPGSTRLTGDISISRLWLEKEP